MNDMAKNQYLDEIVPHLKEKYGAENADEPAVFMRKKQMLPT